MSQLRKKARLAAFKEPMWDEDEGVEREGFLATIVFVIGFSVAFVVLALMLFNQDRTFSEVHTEMTLEKYEGIAEKAPRCECTAASIDFRSLPGLENVLTEANNLPPSCHPDTGACGLVKAARNEYSSWKPGDDHDSFSSYVLAPAAVSCEEFTNSASRIVDQFKHTTIASSVLFSREEFLQHIDGQISTKAYQISDAIGSQRQRLIRDELSLRPTLPGVNLCGEMPDSNNACDCTQANSVGCQFEYSVGGVDTTGFCNVPGLVYRMELGMLSEDLLSPTVDVGQYSSYDGTISAFYDSCSTAVFNKATTGLDYDSDEAYSQYFTRCSPTECTTIEKRPPTASEALTLALGLLAGVVTVFQVVATVAGKVMTKTCFKDKGVRKHAELEKPAADA